MYFQVGCFSKGFPFTLRFTSSGSNTGKVGWEVKINSSGEVEFNFVSSSRKRSAVNGTRRGLVSVRSRCFHDTRDD